VAAVPIASQSRIKKTNLDYNIYKIKTIIVILALCAFLPHPVV
jgi:hypothetical protein